MNHDASGECTQQTKAVDIPLAPGARHKRKHLEDSMMAFPSVLQTGRAVSSIVDPCPGAIKKLEVSHILMICTYIILQARLAKVRKRRLRTLSLTDFASIESSERKCRDFLNGLTREASATHLSSSRNSTYGLLI